MTINRRDTILIAVLMNVGLLTLLFITSINFSGDAAAQELKEEPNFALLTLPEEPSIAQASEAPRDELDQMLLEMQRETKSETLTADTAPTAAQPTTQIVVKKGDTLEKIAKANKTTVNALQKLNNLPNDKLKIGQKLDVLKSSSTSSEPVADSSGAVYYVVESGDSPWKIAKKLGLNYDDILKLNKMDEAKARNLKVGDKIRVK